MTTGNDKVQAITEAAAHQPVERHDPEPRRWRNVVIVAGLVLCVSLVFGSVYALLRINQLQEAANQNARIAQQLGDQVRDLGGTPRVQPSPVDDSDPNDSDPNDPDVIVPDRRSIVHLAPDIDDQGNWQLVLIAVDSLFDQDGQPSDASSAQPLALDLRPIARLAVTPRPLPACRFKRPSLSETSPSRVELQC